MVNACLNGECCGLELNHSASCAVNDEIHLTYIIVSAIYHGCQICWKRNKFLNRRSNLAVYPERETSKRNHGLCPSPNKVSHWWRVVGSKYVAKYGKIRWQNSLKHHLLSNFAGNLRLLKSFEMTLQALYNGPLKPPTTNFRIIPTWYMVSFETPEIAASCSGLALQSNRFKCTTADHLQSSATMLPSEVSARKDAAKKDTPWKWIKSWYVCAFFAASNLLKIKLINPFA